MHPSENDKDLNQHAADQKFDGKSDLCHLDKKINNNLITTSSIKKYIGTSSLNLTIRSIQIVSIFDLVDLIYHV